MILRPKFTSWFTWWCHLVINYDWQASRYVLKQVHGMRFNLPKIWTCLKTMKLQIRVVMKYMGSRIKRMDKISDHGGYLQWNDLPRDPTFVRDRIPVSQNRNCFNLDELRRHLPMYDIAITLGKAHNILSVKLSHLHRASTYLLAILPVLRRVRLQPTVHGSWTLSRFVSKVRFKQWKISKNIVIPG